MNDVTDPAIEAAQSALDQRPWFGYGNEAQLALIAAHEALKPLRKLHRPTQRYAHPDAGCECVTCAKAWPCDTARLVYSGNELQ